MGSLRRYQRGGAITANQWNFVALVENGNAYSFYVNGLAPESVSACCSSAAGCFGRLCAAGVDPATYPHHLQQSCELSWRDYSKDTV